MKKDSKSGFENPQLDFLIYPDPQNISGDQLTFNTEIYINTNRIYLYGFYVSCTDPEGSWYWEFSQTNEKIYVWTNSSCNYHETCMKPLLIN